VQDGQAYVRAAGTWDDMPWHLDQAYRLAGQRAQAAFWGEGDPQESMLHQLALKTGAGAPVAETPAAPGADAPTGEKR
jgi:hypothetical protein